MSETTSRRKDEHIAIVLEKDVEFRSNSTLLDQVLLVHEALPDLALCDIDTSVELLGKRLRIPLVIAGMTGGSAQSAQVNQQLARIAQERSIGFGLGSQRAMLQDPTLTSTYRVRDAAPDALVLGNIGVTQARYLNAQAANAMVRDVEADALCVHMNPAMEIVQPEGEQDFREGLRTFERLSRELSVPVVAKETGCGISVRTARMLRQAGILHVDVSGAGGTSWVAVETHRATHHTHSLGELLREWGIPTAASVAMARMAGMDGVIATGGIRSGLDIARAIRIGATACGMARWILQALHSGGPEQVHALLDQIERELRAVMLLVGARDIAALRRALYVPGPDLQRWIDFARDPRNTS